VVDGKGFIPFDPLPATSPNQIAGVADWSLFLRLNYEFPLFGVKMNSAEKGLVPGLNQWKISEILAGAGVQIDQIRASGAIISMNAKFDCDFNHGTEDCKPDWVFSRIDKTSQDQTFSTGFNFYDVFNNPANPSKRTVNKRYGIKLEFGTSGRAGQFSIVATMIALGSGLALFSVASIVTDFILSHYWHGAGSYLCFCLIPFCVECKYDRRSDCAFLGVIPLCGTSHYL